jgi:hypothetical protein
MSELPPEQRSGPPRVYLSASNRFYLALKVFGYNLLGYLVIVGIFLVIALIVGLASLVAGR